MGRGGNSGSTSVRSHKSGRSCIFFRRGGFEFEVGRSCNGTGGGQFEFQFDFSSNSGSPAPPVLVKLGFNSGSTNLINKTCESISQKKILNRPLYTVHFFALRGPVLLLFRRFLRGETQIWLGDLRVVLGCWFLVFFLFCLFGSLPRFLTVQFEPLRSIRFVSSLFIRITGPSLRASSAKPGKKNNCGV